jgi:hypothetical protein
MVLVSLHKEYLLFRVIWDHQKDINNFNQYMRDSLILQRTNGISAIRQQIYPKPNPQAPIYPFLCLRSMLLSPALSSWTATNRSHATNKKTSRIDE